MLQVTSVSSLSFVPSHAHQFSISSPSTSAIANKVQYCTPNCSFLEMKVSRGKSKHSKSNSLHSINQHRKRIAGKPGSKHFLDPNKVFVGNLSYDTTVDDLKKFLKQHLGGLNSVESVKIIHDWKTNKSKGFGFVQFYDPIFATSAMESIKNKKLKGRVIRLDQGRKKDDLENRILFVKKREKRNESTDEETRVIDGALNEVEASEINQQPKYSLEDFEDEEDKILFGENEDSDDDEFDGWFEEIYGGSKWEELDEEEAKDKNREQRREAQRLKPRKKLPKKGFA